MDQFLSFAVDALKQAHKSFGTYAYNDKGPHEVLDVEEIIAKLRQVPKEDVVEALLKLCADKSTDLDPSSLVCAILIDLQCDDEMDFLFENEALLEAADF